MAMKWDNEKRSRYIYLLLFSDHRVYVGQSATPVRRIKAHRRNWRESFLPIVVYRLTGEQVHAIEYEYSWRWTAHLNGWTPIDQEGADFDMSTVRDYAKRRGAQLPWPTTI